MVGWGTEPTDIENPQKVASSEGEELYVGNSRPSPPVTRDIRTNCVIAKKLLEKSELLKGLMQGTSASTPTSISCVTNLRLFLDVQDDTGPIPLNNVAMNVLKKVISPSHLTEINFVVGS